MAERVTREELAEALTALVRSLMCAEWEPTEEEEDGWPAGANAKRLVARLDAETQEPRHAPEPEDAVDAAVLRRAANVFRLGRLT